MNPRPPSMSIDHSASPSVDFNKSIIPPSSDTHDDVIKHVPTSQPLFNDVIKPNLASTPNFSRQRNVRRPSLSGNSSTRSRSSLNNIPQQEDTDSVTSSQPSVTSSHSAASSQSKSSSTQPSKVSSTSSSGKSSRMSLKDRLISNMKSSQSMTSLRSQRNKLSGSMTSLRSTTSSAQQNFHDMMSAIQPPSSNASFSSSSGKSPFQRSKKKSKRSREYIFLIPIRSGRDGYYNLEVESSILGLGRSSIFLYYY